MMTTVAKTGRLLSLRWFVVLVATVLLVAGCANPSAYPRWQGQTLPLPEPADIPFGQGRIWQVDLPNLEPSYLFGTIHVTDPRVFDLPEAAEQAFAKSKIAAFEAPTMDKPSEQETKTHLELPKGQSLETVIGAPTYRRLRDLSFFRMFRVNQLDRMQPWVVWFLIADNEVDVGFRHNPEGPILDDWLQRRAEDDGKEVVFLESREDQWEVFSGLSMEDQLSMLRSAIDSYNGPRTRVDRAELYLKGDLAVGYALWQRFLGQFEPAAAQRFHERLGTNRNRHMAERLMAVFARGSTFVAVGAMHMPGEDGILRLLERQGFVVTRLH